MSFFRFGIATLIVFGLVLPTMAQTQPTILKSNYFTLFPIQTPTAEPDSEAGSEAGSEADNRCGKLFGFGNSSTNCRTATDLWAGFADEITCKGCVRNIKFSPSFNGFSGLGRCGSGCQFKRCALTGLQIGQPAASQPTNCDTPAKPDAAPVSAVEVETQDVNHTLPMITSWRLRPQRRLIGAKSTDRN